MQVEMVTKHAAGMIEIETGHERLILTSVEYEAARRRGESVSNNRRHAAEKQGMASLEAPVL